MFATFMLRVKMKICCLSDLHGFLPEPKELPDCELLVMAGDYSPHPRTEREWTWGVFVPWLEQVSQRFPIVSCGGNHDIMYENNPDLIPRDNWTYLQDTSTEVKGLKIFGSPWTRRFYDWGFNLDQEPLAKKWKLIPDDTDILITHSPVYMYGDYSSYGNENIGCPALYNRILDVKPKLCVFGHAHAGYGQYKIGNTILVNASHVDERYEKINPVIVVEI